MCYTTRKSRLCLWADRLPSLTALRRRENRAGQAPPLQHRCEAIRRRPTRSPERTRRKRSACSTPNDSFGVVRGGREGFKAPIHFSRFYAKPKARLLNTMQRTSVIQDTRRFACGGIDLERPELKKIEPRRSAVSILFQRGHGDFGELLPCWSQEPLPRRVSKVWPLRCHGVKPRLPHGL